MSRRVGSKRRCRFSTVRFEAGTFASRGLLPSPEPFGTALLLALENVETEAHYRDWLESIWPGYSATARVMHAFDAAVDDARREEVLASARDELNVNSRVVEALVVLVGVGRKAA